MILHIDLAGNLTLHDSSPGLPGQEIQLSANDLDRLQDDKGRLQPNRWVVVDGVPYYQGQEPQE